MGGKSHNYSVHMTDEVFRLALECMKHGGDKSMNAMIERLVRQNRNAVSPCDECRLALALHPVVHILESVPKALKPILRREKANGKKKRKA